MNQKRQYKTYTKAFKEEAVALITDQGYTVPEAVTWSSKFSHPS